MAQTLLVDPSSLRLPPSRFSGADPVKLARQISRFGNSIAGMPDLEVTRGANGLLMLNDGVTRATRVAKFLPGVQVRVVVIETRPKRDLSAYPTVGDRLP
jgi:hypothetical protein